MRTSLLVGTVVLGAVVAGATPAAGGSVGSGPAAAAPQAASSIVVAPTAEVLFNDPTGDEAAQDRIADRIRDAIDATPEHGTIRMAAYSFDRADIADALRRACTRRQVTVQVVLNDNYVSGATRRLQRVLGAGPGFDRGACGADAGPSFVKVCKASCRLGDRGNQHMKIYLFSRTAEQENVVMLGSANLTDYAAGVHWNDMVTFTGSQQLYDDYSGLFAELAGDLLVSSPGVDTTHGDVTTSVAAGLPETPDDDAVARRLAGIDCRALPGTGVEGRTAIRISMYGWQGVRGLDLARRVVGLSNEGCRVQALVSAAAPDVVQTLLEAGVRVRSASLDVDGNKETGFEDSGWEHFVHEKWMSVDGTWEGAATRAVWTGSENWSDVSLLNDELVAMIPRTEVHEAYAEHFQHVWDHWSKKIEPVVEQA